MKEFYIKSLINSDRKVVGELYTTHRDPFINFGKKYGLEYDDLVDIYQDAFIALRKHAIGGKLSTINSSLKTYLFGIGKYMIFDRLKERRKTVHYDSLKIVDDSIELIPFENNNKELTIEQQILRTHFKNLGKKCREMLTLFYSRGLTIDEIVELTNYSNSGVVRSHKSRCLKTLKEMIKHNV